MGLNTHRGTSPYTKKLAGKSNAVSISMNYYARTHKKLAAR